jgi:hypothetical protein
MMISGDAMNDSQEAAIRRLQEALMSQRNVKIASPLQFENSDGLVFTEVEGVTVIIGLQGGYKIPAIRTYPTGIESVVNARSLWQQQMEWDIDNPLEAQRRRTGHLRPVVTKELKCGDKDCSCSTENAARLRGRSLG